MKILFFGLGSIGERHARLLTNNFSHELYAIRTTKKQNDLPIKEISKLDEIKADVAFITNPTDMHIKTAIECAKHNLNLFIEKPLSNSEEELEELRHIIEENNLTSYTAFCLRFHPVIKWMKEHLKENTPTHVSIYNSSFLPTWRKGTNSLDTHAAHKERGGGVILECSHEIDYLYYLFEDFNKIKSLAKKTSNVTVDSEDTADILIETKSGTLCNIHLNFMSHYQRREIIIDFPNHTIIGDLVNAKIEIKGEEPQEITFEYDADQIYLEQLQYFFSKLSEENNMNNINESIKVQKYINKIKEGITQ